MCRLVEKSPIWIKCLLLKKTCSGRRSSPSLLCITQVSAITTLHDCQNCGIIIYCRVLTWRATRCLHTGKCSCKEKKLRSVSDLCKTKHGYGKYTFFVYWLNDKWLIPLAALLTGFLSVLPTSVIKASVLSAHDKGSHAEVHVKVRKVLHSGQTALSLGTISIYPLSWTSRGCTCPILNPGKMTITIAIHFYWVFFGIKSWENTLNRIKPTSCLHQVWITCWQVQRRLGQAVCWLPCKVWWFHGHPDLVYLYQRACGMDVHELGLTGWTLFITVTRRRCI